MRGADAMQESLFTVAKLDDFVPTDHPLRVVRLLVNEALTQMNARFNETNANTGQALKTAQGRLAGCGGMPRNGRVDDWRGDDRCGISVAAPFGSRCPTSNTMAPFPVAAHRTGHADRPHPALGQGIMLSPTEGRVRR